MSRVRFRKDSDEEMCGLPIPTIGGNPAACMRTAGHVPPCIAMAGDAAEADGVCYAYPVDTQ